MSFDPARIAEMIDGEDFILAALQDAYQRGHLDYLRFSPAWDVTIARMIALSCVQKAAPVDGSGGAGETRSEAQGSTRRATAR